MAASLLKASGENSPTARAITRTWFATYCNGVASTSARITVLGSAPAAMARSTAICLTFSVICVIVCSAGGN
jgi:hypothetical protein